MSRERNGGEGKEKGGREREEEEEQEEEEEEPEETGPGERQREEEQEGEPEEIYKAASKEVLLCILTSWLKEWKQTTDSGSVFQNQSADSYSLDPGYKERSRE